MWVECSGCVLGWWLEVGEERGRWCEDGYGVVKVRVRRRFRRMEVVVVRVVEYVM